MLLTQAGKQQTLGPRVLRLAEGGPSRAGLSRASLSRPSQGPWRQGGRRLGRSSYCLLGPKRRGERPRFLGGELGLEDGGLRVGREERQEEAVWDGLDHDVTDVSARERDMAEARWRRRCCSWGLGGDHAEKDVRGGLSVTRRALLGRSCARTQPALDPSSCPRLFLTTDYPYPNYHRSVDGVVASTGRASGARPAAWPEKQESTEAVHATGGAGASATHAVPVVPRPRGQA